MNRRMEGSVGCSDGACASCFFCGDSLILEEGEGHHREYGVVVESVPRATFEMIEPEFFLQLLVRLFTRPTSLDCVGERFQRGGGWVIRQVVLGLSTRTSFCNQPGFSPGR
jgi:hypothetical protein